MYKVWLSIILYLRGNHFLISETTLYIRHFYFIQAMYLPYHSYFYYMLVSFLGFMCHLVCYFWDIGKLKIFSI